MPIDYPPPKSLSFRVKKVFRYAKIYGVSRTLVKIDSHLHMQRRVDPLAQADRPPKADRHVGLLGCGKFAYGVIAYYLTKHFGPVIKGTMDVDAARAASLAAKYRACYSTTQAEDILADPDIDLVFIASDHASHADYAVAALQAGKSVHIEKPHVVSEKQLVQLCRTMASAPGKVRLGFNRPNSPFGHLIRRHLDDMPGTMMMSFFVVGHELEQGHWYLRPDQGGRVLGNLCHWTDFVYQLMPPDKRYPIVIRPMRTERADCDIVVSYAFGDGSTAVICFSEKGDTFEGVRERFSAQKSETLIAMDDFQRMVIDVADRKLRWNVWHRDQGHEATMVQSYGLSGRGGHQSDGCAVSYIWETGELFLKTKAALENREEMVVEPFNEQRLNRGDGA